MMTSRLFRVSRRSFVAASLLLLTSVGAACSDDDPASPEDAATVLRVPAEGVERSGGFARVVFSVENRSGAELQLRRCGEVVWVAAERQLETGWQQYISGICPAIYEQARTPLPTGQTFTGTVNISQAGRYRLSIDAGDRMITSTAFEVR